MCQNRDAGFPEDPSVSSHGRFSLRARKLAERLLDERAERDAALGRVDARRA